MSKKPNNRILALDYGSRRIGVAIGDTLLNVALPRGIIENTTFERVIGDISTLVHTEDVTLILLGVPIGMQGKESVQEKDIRDFCTQLQEKISIPVQLVDERLTTRLAREKMSSTGLSSREQRKHKDSLAAQIILEGYFAHII